MNSGWFTIWWCELRQHTFHFTIGLSERNSHFKWCLQAHLIIVISQPAFGDLKNVPEYFSSWMHQTAWAQNNWKIWLFVFHQNSGYVWSLFLTLTVDDEQSVVHHLMVWTKAASVAIVTTKDVKYLVYPPIKSFCGFQAMWSMRPLHKTRNRG